MDVKEQTRKAYELFGKGDMETFFNEMIDDNIVWTFPGKEGVTHYQEFTKVNKQ